MRVYIKITLFGISFYVFLNVKETLLDLSIRGELLRLANVLVYEWAAGKHACLNLTEVFPLVELMIVSLL
jgi:hypothetical protein